MPVIAVYVDEKTMKRLERTSALGGRSVEQLAEGAVARAASDLWAGRPDDPSREWPMMTKAPDYSKPLVYSGGRRVPNKD